MDRREGTAEGTSASGERAIRGAAIFGLVRVQNSRGTCVRALRGYLFT